MFHKYDLYNDLQLSATWLNMGDFANPLVFKDRIRFLRKSQLSQKFILGVIFWIHHNQTSRIGSSTESLSI